MTPPAGGFGRDGAPGWRLTLLITCVVLNIVDWFDEWVLGLPEYSGGIVFIAETGDGGGFGDGYCFCYYYDYLL